MTTQVSVMCSIIPIIHIPMRGALAHHASTHHASAPGTATSHHPAHTEEAGERDEGPEHRERAQIQSVMRNPLVMRNLLATQDVDPSASALGSGPRPGYFLTIFSCIARSRLTRSAWVRTRAESA